MKRPYDQGPTHSSFRDIATTGLALALTSCALPSARQDTYEPFPTPKPEYLRLNPDFAFFDIQTAADGSFVVSLTDVGKEALIRGEVNIKGIGMYVSRRLQDVGLTVDPATCTTTFLEAYGQVRNDGTALFDATGGLNPAAAEFRLPIPRACLDSNTQQPNEFSLSTQVRPLPERPFNMPQYAQDHLLFVLAALWAISGYVTLVTRKSFWKERKKNISIFYNENGCLFGAMAAICMSIIQEWIPATIAGPLYKVVDEWVQKDEKRFREQLNKQEKKW